MKALIEYLTPELGETFTARKIPPHLQVLTALQFYGHGSYQKMVGQDLFMPMSQASVSKYVNKVTQAILKCLSNKISFPRTNDEMQQKKVKFMAKNDFPGIIGIVNGTHIGIISPPTNDPNAPADLFYNSKGFYSLNVQIICDSDYKILNVNTKYPGSLHNSEIWHTSGVREMLKQHFETGVPSAWSAWLLGDQGYPLEPWLLTPVANTTQGTPEAKYNAAFGRSRIMVNHCIGYLKSVFRCLHKDRILHYSPLNAGNITAACCILHNIRIENNELVESDLIHDHLESESPQDEETISKPLTRHGKLTRQRLIRSRFT